MNVRLKGSVTDAGDGYHNIKVSKVILSRVIDYFLFNTDDRPFFDGEGQLDGVEDVPPAFIDLVAEILDIYMDASDWEVVISHIRSGHTRETVMREVNDLLEEKGLAGHFAVNAHRLTERDV